MKFYTQQHQYYYGIHLHARRMCVCIIDQSRAIKEHRNLKASAEPEFDVFAPCRSELGIAVEYFGDLARVLRQGLDLLFELPHLPLQLLAHECRTVRPSITGRGGGRRRRIARRPVAVQVAGVHAAEDIQNFRKSVKPRRLERHRSGSDSTECETAIRHYMI